MLFGSLATAAALLLSATAQAATVPYDVVRKRALTFPYGSTKVRGVNLGGWFVLEPWITPGLFTGNAVDEYHLCKNLGKTACHQRLSAHWNSFYTANDFNQIKAAGMNHVRIPIGYWAVDPLDNDPYVQGQIPILDKAIKWAGAAGLKVWIDLHGAPGSQNGFDNSGLRDQINWQNVPANVEHTKRVIRMLAKKYALPKYNNVVTAIQLLNEPLGPRLDLNQIKQYWTDGWGITREYGDIAVVIHDAFQDPPSWNGFMTSGWSNVILDTHKYQVFSPGENSMNINDHIGTACSFGRMLRTCDKWTIVGEWSGALTDCTKWLNGIGRGARYDGSFPGSWWVGSCTKRTSGSINQFSAAGKAKTRRYIEAQLDAYEQGAGWFFWTWKTEQGSPEWEMRDLINNGVFPQPVTSRHYPNQCGF
ncbi:glycoside hydrolase superfamily [Sphaerosporella brunnea]|uniref:glucan 1,3-beta-glucosidase n=1 Tax=Sphaerosporella brunnea TaxID=1250544 RepID=A0A5J5EUZ5_9PEZI|nr:glycoside hydrolase superfamily [Sphaerosporella brunnea]